MLLLHCAMTAFKPLRASSLKHPALWWGSPALLAFVVRNRAIQWVEVNMKNWEKEMEGRSVTVSGLMRGFPDLDHYTTEWEK